MSRSPDGALTGTPSMKYKEQSYSGSGPWSLFCNSAHPNCIFQNWVPPADSKHLQCKASTSIHTSDILPKEAVLMRSLTKVIGHLTLIIVAASIATPAGAQSTRRRTSGNGHHRNLDARKQANTSAAFLANFDLYPAPIGIDDEVFRADDLEAISSTPEKKKKRRSSLITPAALVTIVVTNTADSGLGSLRDAITTANGNGMPDEIVFNIPTSDPGFNGSTFTIQPLTALLPLLAGNTAINGASQTAFTGDANPAGPEIVLNGALAPLNTAGLRFQSANNSVSSLVINGFTGPGGDGVRMQSLTATGNVVTGCYIGTDAAGSSIVANGGNGVSVVAGANTNRVGGPAASDRNVISGQRTGINIAGTPTSTAGDNIVQNNFVGTDVTGSVLLGNEINGISIVATTDNQVLGNVSSGNSQNGMRIGGGTFDLTPADDVDGPFVVNAATGNLVRGNKFGTNAAGTAALPNGIDGVRLNHGAQSNIIGGPAAGDGNLCSGNVAHGIHLDGARANFVPFTPVSFNTIQGNLVGASASGLSPMSNLLPGVIIFLGASDNLVGGSGAGEGNLIAFNTGSDIPDGQGGTITVPGAGVCIAFDPAFSDPIIANDPCERNRISGNSIHSNDGLGIDLNSDGNATDANDGVTVNDAGDGDVGPNNHQNFPIIATAEIISGSLVVTGTLDTPSPNTASVEFFGNGAADPSGFGEGEQFLGAAAPGPSGAFTATLPAIGAGSFVTATATDALGNTSEFSAAVEIVQFRVTIDIKPGSFPNSINTKSNGKIPVAILSTATFDAPATINGSTLTFGRTGNELSLSHFTVGDVNGDGRPDLVGHFFTQLTGFVVGDTVGIIKGHTFGGQLFVGTDSVRIVH